MKNQFKTIKFIALILVLSLGVIASSAQGNVSVPLDDIPAGQQVTITYNVTVNTLPEGLLFIENQGLVTGLNFDDMYSNDPDSEADGDETLTPVGFTLDVVQLPNTGENPWYRIPIISGIIALLVSVGGVFIFWKKLSFID